VKSSVVWDRGAGLATSGCLDAATGYDWDPAQKGIQGKCTVTEVTFGGSGATRTETGRRTLEPCAADKPTFPCWYLSVNPHVCPKGPGALVKYGDHKVRGNVDISVQCQAAPAPVPPPDAFAPVSTEVAPGQPTFRKPEVQSKHDQLEEFANGPPPEHTNMFFSIYFAMTGLHGLHVLVGIFIFIWLLVRAIKGHFTPDYFGPVDYAALYWHLVDLIWIFLFPLLYLIH
jgi:hypothetical protein